MISPRGSNDGSRILAIDKEAKTIAVTIRVAGRVCDGEFVVHSLSGGGELLVEIGGNAVTIFPACAAERSIRAS